MRGPNGLSPSQLFWTSGGWADTSSGSNGADHVDLPMISLTTTNYNTAPITRKSLDSILGLVSGLHYEIVCTDNFSDDGSFEALAGYGALGYPIKVIRQKCSRGLGREIAFRHARGDLIVAVDLDTVYTREWRRFLDWYLERLPPYVLTATFSGIYPRKALDAVGGWRDFQYWEDVDLWVRLASKGLWRTYPLQCGENYKRNPSGIGRKTPRLYARLRDTIAIANWIPVWIYWQGYSKRFPLPSEPFQNLYYHALLCFSLGPGRLKRLRLCRQDYHPESMVKPDAFVDCGLVPPEQLRPLVTEFDSREGVIRAANEGRYFTPGVYD